MSRVAIYHSALAEELDSNLDPVGEVLLGRVRAFTCDLALRDTMPEAFDACDVIYGEPPFTKREGWLFRERAGYGADRGWDFLKPLIAKVNCWHNPVVLIGGVPLMAQMPVPDSSKPIWLEGPGKHHQGVRAKALGWNVDLPACKYTGDLIEWLAERFKIVGDPFCGYGRTGSIVVRAGGSAVLSDISPRCIAYIASRAGSWQL